MLPANGLFGQALVANNETGSEPFFNFPSFKVRNWKNAMNCAASPRFHSGVRVYGYCIIKTILEREYTPQTQWNYWCYAQCSCIMQRSYLLKQRNASAALTPVYGG